MGNLHQLMTKKNWNKVKRLIAQGQWKPLVKGVIRKVRHQENQIEKAYAYAQVKKQYLRRKNEIESSMLGISVDIIVPVYNGKDYLETLLPSLEKTKTAYRLIIIDDASPDEDTKVYLQEYANNRDNVALVRNAQNMGFVGSVNRGLAMSRNHVVIVNTDVQVPDGWLERLIAPIVKDPTVASATPFTNSGTICSFPEFLQDNTLLNQQPVDQIDRYFREIRCLYTTIPTGVGFCMAMSQRAIHEVGLFDQKTFSKGYGEENDWCQRAIEKGFRNVMVENLYVFHNHGGTFTSAEKKRLIQMNREKLAIKHPNYANLVGEYTLQDPMGPIRAYVFGRITSALAPKRYAIFHNDLGGGSDAYIQKYAAKRRNEKAAILFIRYQKQINQYQIEYQWETHKVLFQIQTLEDVFEFCSQMDVNQLVVNQLVSYPRIEEHLQKIREYAEKKGIRLTMMVHDYYLICPSIYLLNDQQAFCHLPAMSECEQCIRKNPNCDNYELDSVRAWRITWRSFLQACQEIRVFSQSSAQMIIQAYGNLDQIQVLPVQHTMLSPVQKPYKTTDTIHIGLLGTLTDLKGSRLIQQMIEIAENKKLPVRFILCGSSTDSIRSRYFQQTGPYQPSMLPRLVLQYDIDLFFISSICPETFSYTTQEALEMDMPVACLPLGAPVERIVRAKKGKVLSEVSAERNLTELIAFAEAHRMPRKQSEKALFIIEEESYASRYRVQHLQEQLWGAGIDSECVDKAEVRLSKIHDYKWIVIYRCEYSNRMKRIITEANESGASIWYGIDDLVFDYRAVRDLDFVRQPEYRSFQKKCERIYACMQECDGVLVSTEMLRKEVQSRFPGKSVVVQRNVASYEMIALSQKALEQTAKTSQEVVLGYLSGSSTHNDDFALIEPVLVSILKAYPQVKLQIGGVLELPAKLAEFDNRIIRWPFQPWQELPELLSHIDINLMPLQKTVFHTCKSENKWLEAALVKVPTVASYNEELAEVIHNQVDGVLCRSQEEWKEALVRLIETPDQRKEIGRRAYETVMETHTTKQVEEEVLRIFE